MARESALDVLDRYARAKSLRGALETQWRMNAAYCLPRDYPRWTAGDAVGEGNDYSSTDWRARYAFDNTGVRAIPKYKAICKRLINPEGVRYHALEASDAELMRIPRVRGYFADLTKALFRYRQEPNARFGTAQGEMYGSIGVYGNGVKTTLWRPPAMRGDKGGFVYKTWPMYHMFWLVDDMGFVTDVFRRIWMTRRQFELAHPGHELPPCLANIPANSASAMSTRFEFVHAVSKRNSGYDPKALDARRHPWQSCYVCVSDQMYIGEESGFQGNPYQISATDTVAGDAYGYSPAEQAFPALGGANAIKKTYLKQGHKAVDPTLLVNDDGVLSGRVDMRPGKYILGGVDSQGRQLVQALNHNSNFQVAENILTDERADINDSFMVTLFQILTETPEMTAAEVYERVAEKAALFAPTMAALQEMDQGPQVERELYILAEHGLMPPPPPELVEAGNAYKVNYTNPATKAQNASEVSGFIRWVDMLANAANLTQDPEPLDHINWDNAAPEVAYKMDVPSHWQSSTDEVAAKRDNRAKQMQARMAVEAAPAAASAMATMSKQGAVPSGR